MATIRRKFKNDDQDEENSDVDEIEVEEKRKDKKQQVLKKKPASWNYAAIFILVLFLLVPMITLGIQGYDMLYPKAAVKRLTREKVLKCYSAAKPKEIIDVDKIMKKYDEKEHILLATLRNKYSKFPECHMN